MNLGSDRQPDWLTELANAAAAEIRALDILAPVGCHVRFNQARAQHEVSVFVGKTVVLGGPQDGQTIESRFAIDLWPVLARFQKIEHCFWQAHPGNEDDDLKVHVSIHGLVSGNDVWLRILQSCPERFADARQFNAYTLQFQDLWE